MTDPVSFDGVTSFVRTVAGISERLQHAVRLLIYPTYAVLRVTNLDTKQSCSAMIADNAALGWIETQDAMLTAGSSPRAIAPIWKNRRRRVKTERLPSGWVWCDACLGDPDAAPTCNHCDGERIIRRPDD